jgi:Holliday junction resolvase
MTSAAKNKGNTWERELCKILSKHFTGSFIRVPHSGAYVGASNNHRAATMSATQVRAMRGDIVPPDHLPKMVLECKFYKDFSYHQLLSNERIAQLDKWIEQTKDCVQLGDRWFLCVKINRKGSFVVFDKLYLPHLKLKNYTIYFDYVVCDLEDLFTNNVEFISTICQ